MIQNFRNFSDAEVLGILALSTDATAIYTTENIIIEMANDAMIAFWGKDRSVIGKPLEEAVPELKGQEFIEILKNVWRTGVTYAAKERPAQLTVNKESNIYYFDFIYRAIKNADGSTYCILHSATDVTERVYQTKAIHHNEARQAFLLKLSDNIRPLADAAIIQTEAARIIGEHLGVSRVGYGEVTEQRWFRTEHNWTDGTVPQYHGVHDLEAFGPGIMTTFKKGEKLVVNDMLNDPRTAHPDMQAAFAALQFRSAVTISLIKEGRFVAAFYIHDRNPRKWVPEEVELIAEVAERTWSAVGRAHAEAALRASEERYRTLFNSIEQAFMLIELIYDSEGKPVDYRMIDMNPAFERQTGLKSTLGKTVRQILPDVEQYWINAYHSVAQSGNPMHFEDYNKSTDGWYNVYAASVGKASNQVVVIFADITERKRSEQRKNDFISMASHELKTPLTSIKAYIQMLGGKANKAGDNFTGEAFKKVELQVNKMQGLIKGFLDVAKLESGKIQLNRQDFQLDQLITDVIDEAKLIVQSHDIIFEHSNPTWVNADKDKIGQVLSNFLNNAVKYSPKGKQIILRCTSTDDTAQVSVIDEGIGIKSKDIPKLFERFYRVENKQTETIAGFGIGLYLCAEIIEQHQGKIGVNSTVGQGSTFWFSLPVVRANENLFN
ncbi:ATP-binding protein [Mucilaginibacter lacusdianchii]|uniref:ATP-binding protein n=1 Tax=Mucilaginibacter lacusdianchii TaxID=2684211 RepID=UPI00131C869C|nr:ATP-binding protein [Mucilaginibacter sp. JXJ CY 39]